MPRSLAASGLAQNQQIQHGNWEERGPAGITPQGAGPTLSGSIREQVGKTGNVFKGWSHSVGGEWKTVNSLRDPNTTQLTV